MEAVVVECEAEVEKKIRGRVRLQVQEGKLAKAAGATETARLKRGKIDTAATWLFT
jgi:hypothetical protein